MKSFWRLIFICGFIGAAIPLIWLAVNHMGGDIAARLMLSGNEWILLMIWPGSVMMLAMPESISIGIFALSVFSNAVLYASMGAIFWIGIKRSKLILIIAVSIIILLWFLLFKLYY